MKATVRTKITINAPKAVTFQYLTDLKYHYLWNPQVQYFSSTKPLRLGSEYKTVSIVLGVKITSKNVVTGFIPGQELQLENKTGTVHYKVCFRLAGSGQKTVVSCETDVSSDSKSFAFARPVLNALARRELQTDMQALKIAAENRLE